MWILFNFHPDTWPHHSSWHPTAATQVRARVWSCEICGGQTGAGAGFLRVLVLRFPLPIFIPPIAPQSPSSVIWDWYNKPVVAAVPSGLSHPLRYKKRKKKCPDAHNPTCDTAHLLSSTMLRVEPSRARMLCHGYLLSLSYLNTGSLSWFADNSHGFHILLKSLRSTEISK
jgi:hypothetical protein